MTSSQFRLSKAEIARIVRELAERIRTELDGADLCVVAVMRGGMMLAVDLVRALHPMPLALDIYPGTTAELAGKHLLLVDDIVDSGQTAARLVEWARAQGAGDVSFCTLLQRHGRSLPCRAFVGMTIESDEWVKGYGMDDGGGVAGRELPYIVSTGRRSERAKVT